MKADDRKCRISKVLIFGVNLFGFYKLLFVSFQIYTILPSSFFFDEQRAFFHGYFALFCCNIKLNVGNNFSQDVMNFFQVSNS